MDKSKQSWWRGQRGEWYVIAQFALFLLIVLGPRTVAGLPPWPADLISFSSIAGMVLLALGGLVSLLAVIASWVELDAAAAPEGGRERWSKQACTGSCVTRSILASF